MREMPPCVLARPISGAGCRELTIMIENIKHLQGPQEHPQAQHAGRPSTFWQLPRRSASRTACSCARAWPPAWPCSPGRSTRCAGGPADTPRVAHCKRLAPEECHIRCEQGEALRGCHRKTLHVKSSALDIQTGKHNATPPWQYEALMQPLHAGSFRAPSLISGTI